MTENNPVTPSFSVRYVAPHRRSWKGFEAQNVVVVDTSGNYSRAHADDILSLPDGRELTLSEAQRAAYSKFDHVAAKAYVNHMLDNNPEALETLKKRFDHVAPTIIWEDVDPARDRHTPRNALPAAYAQALTERLGWECASSDYIKKISPSGRKEANQLERVINQPSYNTHVTKGKKYLVIDDHLTCGTTAATINGYIEEGGGHVVGVSVMTTMAGGKNLKPTVDRLNDIKAKLGEENFFRLHQAFFNKDGKSECLFTDGELKEIGKFCDSYKGHKPTELFGQSIALSEPGKDEVFGALVDELIPINKKRIRNFCEHSIGQAFAGAVNNQKTALESLKEDIQKEREQNNPRQWARTRKRGEPLADEAPVRGRW